MERGRIRVTPSQAVRLVAPYSAHQLLEQIVVVLPVVLYMALFQWVILRWGIARIAVVAGGIGAVILGLALFMEGIKIGLLPMGEVIGRVLPQRRKAVGVLSFAFLLGILAAIGEPVLGSLQIAGSGVDPSRTPLLYALLLGRPGLLIGAVGLGVGVAFVLGMLRNIKGFSVKPLVLGLVAAAAALTLIARRNEDMATVIGLAWDTGAVIAGPVSTPLVLALGAGVCLVAGRSNTGMAGFGSVGLMSLFPVVFVGLLVFGAHEWLDYEGVAASAGAAKGAVRPSPAGDLALESLVSAARAIVPLFVLLWVSLRVWLKEREEGIPLSHFALAAGFAVGGLFLFNLGLSIGLSDLGNQIGAQLPRTFHPPGEALYSDAAGRIIVVVFGALLGYGATLAEPAFNTLGMQIEEVTQGAFKKWLFGQAVAIGVGVGAGLGMASLVYGLDLVYLLLAPYALLFLLTIVSDEKYCAIAWDGGAVTTGPVTVPLKIAVGIAISHATGFAEGFGILALASAYPVLNILLLGQFVRLKQRRHHQEVES